ncbi:hypothetical protein M378DRAFT_92690, partial [Amanita muscaria Koide BX008]
LHTFDAHLKTGTFRVGDRITLADIVLAAYIQRALPYSLDAEFRVKIPNIIRHFETIVNQPKLKDVFGSYEYVEKIQYMFLPKVRSFSSPIHPIILIDFLPFSYDPAGFSVWRVDFKYNEELIQTFMSSNQIGGLFNRLEASRKYLFGSVGVLGEMKNSVISGALILRGLEVGPVINVAPDWESYAYSKLDLSNEPDKWFFEAALAWDLEVDGKKWVDGKNVSAGFLTGSPLLMTS